MIDGHVLVLNRSWVAVNVTPARRALTLLFQGHARAVHPLDYSLYDFESWIGLSPEDCERARFVKTPSLRIRLPEVIILSVFNSFVHHEIPFTRRNIFARDNHECQYCGRRFSKQELTVDHVMPRSRGGQDTWDNLVVACVHCNLKKGSRTPDEADMPLLRRPGRPHGLPRLGTRIPRDELMSWQRFVDTSYWAHQVPIEEEVA